MKESTKTLLDYIAQHILIALACHKITEPVAENALGVLIERLSKPT